MKFIVDANLSPRWADLLIAAGHDAAYWPYIGVPDAPDGEIIVHARMNGSIILTRDLDFGHHLSASRALKPSVIQLRAGEVSHRTLGSHVVAEIQKHLEALGVGCLMTIDLRGIARTRVVLLPLS